jgi:hypothetical protein
MSLGELGSLLLLSIVFVVGYVIKSSMIDEEQELLDDPEKKEE